MPNSENIRNQLHIFADNPLKYKELIGDFEFDISVTYDDTANKISTFEKIIYTTQLVFLSHYMIRMGYDIFLYKDGMIILFGEDYLEEIINSGEYMDYSYYYMIDMYRIGELYQTD